jgi:hypothetical protein
MNVDQATLTMIANLEKNTARSLGDWIALVRAAGPLKHGEVVTLLKTKHGLGHGYANLVAHRAKEAALPTATATGTGITPGSPGTAAAAADPADEWFAGDKAAMRPVYDAVLALVRPLGIDVELAPKKGYVSLRRSKQFATVHASTKTRVDVGLQLKGIAPAGRLEAAGSWNAMVTHRVRLEQPAQADAELGRWLRQAYAAAG